jgi:SulP family sulfate permease
LIYRASRPQISLLGEDPGHPGAFEDARRHPGVRTVPGVMVVRPDAPLFYANAQAIRDFVEKTVQSSAGKVHTVILDLDANDDIDITSSEQLEKLISGLVSSNVRFAIAHLHDPARQMLEVAGLLQNVGPEHIFLTLESAVQWATNGEASAVSGRLSPREDAGESGP